jgi:hypothetical protein
MWRVQEGDDDEPPTQPKSNVIAEARAIDKRFRPFDMRVSAATRPAPIDYADMAALLASVPSIAVDAEDVGWFDPDEDAREVLGLIDGVRSVAEIAAKAKAENVLRVLTQLEAAGIVSRSS